MASFTVAAGLIDEVVSSIGRRPVRSALTALGTVLGVAAFVGILGLVALSGNQIDARFDEVSATTVTVTDAGDQKALDATDYSIPADYRARIGRIDGVLRVGIAFTPPLDNPEISSQPPGINKQGTQGLAVAAIDTDTAITSGGHITQGTFWDTNAQTTTADVAVLGSDAASALGITRIDTQPAVFINGRPYLVIGILAGPDRLPELGASIMIPATTALAHYGPPHQPRAALLVTTRTGAADIVGDQIALALRPDNPNLFKIAIPGSPTKLRSAITTTLQTLFLAMSGIVLLIGTVGIANTTLVAVLERTGEIGLRRALGASRTHIAAQFLLESGTLGLFGGIIGTTLATATVITTALTRHWTATLQPWTTITGPLIGLTVGLLAGLYPALRASHIQPAAALRR